MAGRIMPGELYESNMVIMKETNEPSQLTKFFASNVTKLLNQEQNARVEHFTFEVPSLYFPALSVDEDHVPVGNSMAYCLHFDWIKREQKW